MGILILRSLMQISERSQNQLRYGCCSIYSMLILFSGLNSRHLDIKSRHSEEISLKNYLLLAFLVLKTISSTSLPKLRFKDYTSVWEGGPVHIITLSSWLMVEVPGNSGLPFTISASRQPKLQMSIPLEYPLERRSISGALYHLVAMYSVRISQLLSFWSSMDLTSPKSHSLASQDSLTRIFEGLRSRWMSPAECRYSMAFAVWQRMYFLCFQARMLSRMSLCRSTSICSNTRQISLPFSAMMTYSSSMMLGWRSSIRNMIYRQVRWASVELLNASKFFFRALIFLVRRSLTLNTCPYAPLPIFLMGLYLASTWASISSDILFTILKNALFYITIYYTYWSKPRLMKKRSKLASVPWELSFPYPKLLASAGRVQRTEKVTSQTGACVELHPFTCIRPYLSISLHLLGTRVHGQVNLTLFILILDVITAKPVEDTCRHRLVLLGRRAGLKLADFCLPGFLLSPTRQLQRQREAIRVVEPGSLDPPGVEEQGSGHTSAGVQGASGVLCHQPTALDVTRALPQLVHAHRVLNGHLV